MVAAAGSMNLTEWLVGFWEGDGHFEYVNKVYLATLDEVDNKEQNRYAYEILGYGEYSDGLGLRLQDDNCLKFLSLIENNLVSPKKVRKLNSAFPNRFICHKPTLDWLVGNWDANGSSNCDKVYPAKINISSSDVELLAILKFIFSGSYSDGSSGYFPRWRIIPTVADRDRFFEIAGYLIYNSKKGDKRIRLARRVNNWLCSVK